jgi:hypothetical protein
LPEPFSAATVGSRRERIGAGADARREGGVGEFTERRRLDGLTELIGVTEVRRLLGCKLSLAYEHLRRAAGRQPGERGLLRVTKEVWERYALRAFHMSNSTIRLRPEPRPVVNPLASRSGPGKAAAVPRQAATASGLEIPVTRPRPKRSPAAGPTFEETP